MLERMKTKTPAKAGTKPAGRTATTKAAGATAMKAPGAGTAARKPRPSRPELRERKPAAAGAGGGAKTTAAKGGTKTPDQMNRPSPTLSRDKQGNRSAPLVKPAGAARSVRAAKGA